ncbi:tRNA uridine-5-carboxymethylaminomethyl(34) synthesis enzyme MnmG [candidate division KSB1 bacterium]|nr:tRNA uridine-5-carboxymethylaminomethyl(34) synthesis enzyme MnmG [candidate division KSB1 bacterium]
MVKKDFDVIVVGGGHAGCEAALAAARMGERVLLVTMTIQNVAQMSCNPAIGGPAKGHLVREIDALGGEMAKAIDSTGIQFRMLNQSKGPAVWAPRAQADRIEYSVWMRQVVESQDNLTLLQGMAVSVWVDGDQIGGIETETGRRISASAVVLTCGTFLNGLIHIGMKTTPAGRAGEFPATGLTESLVALGFESGRLKTGTPPRVDGNTVDFSKMAIQPGDDRPRPFSFQTSEINTEQIPCYLTHTNPTTHKLLKSGLDRSPLYTGKIKGVGPRYCPSIEDKIVRFSEKEGHQIFLEPEGRRSTEYYVNGFATSLPEDVQLKAIRTIPGMENVSVTRLGYAIEYDFFPPTQLKSSLETKRISGLFFAGQINGTSGYEEAAAQGLIAGINAVLGIQNKPPFVVDRSEGYIGVLVDDLVTKGTQEPYRLFTSRAEYRLLFRQDNADRRLMRYGHELGIISEKTYSRLQKKEEGIERLMGEIQQIKPDPETINPLLKEMDTDPISERQDLMRLIKRPQLHLMDFQTLPEMATLIQEMGDIAEEVMEQVEIEVKYEGYLRRQQEMVHRFKKIEEKIIPNTLDYNTLSALSTEAREKLGAIRPQSLGQASRISGVSPADVSALAVYLSKMNRSDSHVSER